MRAIKKDGYYYDPPSWKVCPDCLGNREIGYDFYEPGVGIPMKKRYIETQWETCPKCKGTGYLPIYYTPEEWKAAGGVLNDDLPIWVQALNSEWMLCEYWEHDEGSHTTPIVIATSAGKPEKEK